MCLIKYHVLIYFALFLYQCSALNCRSDSGPKEADLKNIYQSCLKGQDGRNSSHRGHGDDSRRDRGYKKNSQWNRDDDDRMSSKNDRMNGRDDRMNSRDSRMGSRDDRMNNRDGYNDGMNNRDERLSGVDRRGNRDERMGRDDNRMGRNGMKNDMSMGGTGFGRTDLTGRDDFPSNDGFGFSGQEMAYNTYRSTTQMPRRFRREKRKEINSGQRSQYNPNKSSSEDSYRNDDKNSSENSSSKDKDSDKKACALHCFMENLEMTGDDGMPDRYLVTHAITKDIRDEDLKDFLQESIEECFQILDNENTEDKCEFSKNLLMCLSEKGRANCDDWKDDIKF